MARWVYAFRRVKGDVHKKRAAGRPQSASDDVHMNAGRAVWENTDFGFVLNQQGTFELLLVQFFAYLRRLAARSKPPNLLISHPNGLNDGARSHIASSMINLLHRWNWLILEHPPYSLDEPM